MEGRGRQKGEGRMKGQDVFLRWPEGDGCAQLCTIMPHFGHGIERSPAQRTGAEETVLRNIRVWERDLHAFRTLFLPVWKVRYCSTK